MRAGCEDPRLQPMPIRELICAEPGRLPCAASEVAAGIARDGAVFVRNFESPGVVARLRDVAEQLVAEDLRRYGEAYDLRGVVYHLMTRHPLFLEWMLHPTARAVFQAALGHGCIVHHYCVSAMPPHHPNYASEIHTDVPRSRVIPGYVTNVGMLLALDPFRAENGAFEIVPDSFAELELPTPAEFDRRRLVAEAVPGDALFFNARCAHRGGHNRTAGWRYGIALQATRPYIRQLFDYCRMLPRATIESLPADAQQFLGYWVRMATSMEEYLMPPDRRPTRAGQE